MLRIFEQGRQDGEFRQEIDSGIAGGIFIGTMEHMITLSLLRDRSYSFFENLEETFEIMINAFISTKQQNNTIS